MTPEQALQVLVGAASIANMNLQQHATCQEAAKVLAEAIKPKEEPCPTKQSN